VPDGYRALEVELVHTDDVASWEPEIPAGRLHTVEGLNERFHVLDGTVDLEVPFKVSGSNHDIVGRERVRPLEDGDVTVTAVVRYQVCTDDQCFPPSERRLSVPLVEGALIR
ncbi:MAG: protein-disulfide reductase DsbD family protein, partial [Halobacteriales archaeon]|nr:protein-disulfide reductase DsbD family protein [Halobacteriales archaeon]